MRHGLLAMLLPVATLALAATTLPLPARAGGAPSETKIVAPGSPSEDRFGRAIAVSGDLLAVGAPYDVHADGKQAGSVHVFRRDGAGWPHTATLRSAEPQTFDQFGLAVALDGDALVASATGRPDASYVTVFRRTDADWAIEETLPSPAGGASHFGIDVAISGDVLVVGDYLSQHGEATTPGAAHVYRRSGGTWKHEQTLTASHPDSLDQFGMHVAVDGDVVAVGAPYDDDKGKNAGAVYVFRFDGTRWREEQKLVAKDGGSFDWLGAPVAIEGDRLAAGARGDDDGQIGAGAVYVFRHHDGVWNREEKLRASNPARDDAFGLSLSLGEGRLLVGADRAGANHAGRAYVFERNGKSWQQVAQLAASDGASGSSFGRSVAIGAPGALVGAYRAEAVYSFSLAVRDGSDVR